jgi:hypothetical protein
VNASIALTMRRYSDKSGMSIRKMVGWKLVGILRHSDDCAKQSASRQKHAEYESRRQVHITDLLNWNFLFAPMKRLPLSPPIHVRVKCARIFNKVGARRIAALRFSRAIEGTGLLDPKAPSLQELSTPVEKLGRISRSGEQDKKIRRKWLAAIVQHIHRGHAS